MEYFLSIWRILKSLQNIYEYCEIRAFAYIKKSLCKQYMN